MTTTTTTTTTTITAADAHHSTLDLHHVFVKKNQPFVHGWNQSKPPTFQRHPGTSDDDDDDDEDEQGNDASNIPSLPPHHHPPFSAPSFLESPSSPDVADLLAWTEIESWALYIPDASCETQAEPILHIIFKGGKSDVWKMDKSIRDHPLKNSHLFSFVTDRGTTVSFKGTSSSMHEGSPHAQSAPIPISKDQFSNTLSLLQKTQLELEHQRKLEKWSLEAGQLPTMPLYLLECLPMASPTPVSSPEPPPYSPLSPIDLFPSLMLDDREEQGDRSHPSTSAHYSPAYNFPTDPQDN